MKFIPTIVVLLTLFSATPAFADMFCVQRQLTNLGYEPGPVDGAFGGKTASAAAAFATDFAIALPVLDKTNSAPWCAALTAAAGTPEGMARRFDVTSRPQGVMSEAATTRLWDMYKNIDECLVFDTVEGGKGTPLALALLPAQLVATTPWSSPFTQAIGAPACRSLQPTFATPPAPLPVVRLDEAYGERQNEVDRAMTWFQRASTYVRLTGDPVARAALKAAVLDWAAKDSLGRGIRVSWGQKPIDYQMMGAVLGLVAATAEIIPDLTENDRAVLGPWLNRLVKVVADSNWRDRSDNKHLMRAYIAMLWGIIVDDTSAVREAIVSYKLGLHDMRPDGSFPTDSQRGGMGLQYNSYNVTYLLQMGLALQRAYGLDLFAYSADGRSIHDAVDFLVRSLKTPGETNAIYAISCPDSGDRWGTISDPSMGFEDDASTLLLYAALFPASANAAWINANVLPEQNTLLSEHSGGAAVCQFATPTNAVFTGEPIEIAGIVALPAVKVIMHPVESIAHKVGLDRQVNSLLFAEIENPMEVGLHKLGFNVVGDYDILGKKFRKVELVFSQSLGTTKPEALDACGTSFRTEVWDDGLHHLVVRLTREDNNFIVPDLSCVIPIVPEEAGKMATLISTAFRDFAIGFIRDNTLVSVQHDGLRHWLEQIAMGEVTVAAAAP